MKAWSFVLALALAGVFVMADVAVENIGAYREHEVAGWIVQGQVELPSGGRWQIAEKQADGVPPELYVRPPDRAIADLAGTRMSEVQKQRNLRSGQSFVRQIYWPSVRYAMEHEGVGPASLADLEDRVQAGLNRSPWPASHAEIEGPFVFLIPEVVFHFEDESGRRVVTDKRERLAFELRPFEDDGKHWVLFTDGRVSREPVDAEMVARYQQTIRPVAAGADLAGQETDRLVYTLMTRVLADTPAAFPVRMQNPLTGASVDLQWRWSRVPLNEALLDEWTETRLAAWRTHGPTEPSSILGHWSGILREGARFGRGQADGAFASVFSMFGGRSAIDETLQTRILNNDASMSGPRTIDIGTIEGIEIKSHPYAEMLGERTVSVPELMDLVPADRFAVYVSQPSTIPGMLDGGGSFFAAFGESFSGRALRYDVVERTLRLLGMHRDWLDTLLASGSVRDAVLIADDLFFVDGTDVAVVVRLHRSPVLDTLLKAIGLSAAADDGMIAVPTVEGRKAFWAIRDGWLVAGTSRQSVERVLLTHAHPNESLGRSAEFRYMLYKVPLQEQTRALVYFSDPFIRRLVGPETKIGQLRRAVARARMEHVMAAGLLARLDGWPEPITLGQLQERGQLASDLDVSTLTLLPDGSVVCSRYGSPAWPVGLGQIPVTTVSEQEASAYRTYLGQYNRLWREFFDPIAIRIDDDPDGGLEATTFILPLIDNSLYNGLRGALTTDVQQPLRVPRLDPEPVLTLSLGLSEPSWRRIVQSLSHLFAMGSPIAPALLDDLGPALHFSLFDADPIIALGSGDVFGAFGGNLAGLPNNEMLWIPIALSVLTRPCSLVIETRDPERTLRFLNSAAGIRPGTDRRRFDDFRYEFYRIGDRNEWVYALDLAGLLKLRFGIAVMGEFLVVRNLPWSRIDGIVDLTESALPTARLALTPSAGQQQLPGLHASAMEKQRVAAIGGLMRLYPLMLAMGLSAEDAIDLHADWFGFRPVHPQGGSWTGDARSLQSTAFGRPRQQRQPAYRPGDTGFGLLKTIESLNVSMQFEDDGLRTVLQWKLR